MQQITLVDQVENEILRYFKAKRLAPGDSVPTLQELTKHLGVGTSVVREAISRLRMLGLIESRPHKGMTLKEPPIFSALKRVIDPSLLGDKAMLSLLGFRVALETGIAETIFLKVNSRHIEELEAILVNENGKGISDYSAEHDYEFHTKLYEITGNPYIIEFGEIIYPIFKFAREKYEDHIRRINRERKKAGTLITHRELVKFLKEGNREAFIRGMGDQFKSYEQLLIQIESSEQQEEGEIRKTSKRVS